MLTLSKKILWIALVLVIAMTFGFTFWAISLSQKASVSQIKAIIAAQPVAATSAQTYQVDKAPQIQDGDWLLGDKQAKIRMFVFEDYASPYSAEFNDTLERLKSEYQDRIVFIFRPFISKSDPLSALGSQALVCAGADWLSMRANIFRLVKENKLTADSLKAAAVSKEDFADCLAGLPSLEKSAKLSESAKDYAVIGAPTIFINDSLIVGARPYEDYVDSNGDKVDGLKTIIERIK